MLELSFLFVIFAGVGVVLSTAGRLRRCEAEYSADDSFGGRRHMARIRLANIEAPIICLMGADEDALYVLKDRRVKNTWWRRSNYSTSLHHNMRIPWSDLTYRADQILFKRRMWFAVTSKQMSFFMNFEMGQRLLAEAGKAELPVS